ncbi:FAD-dependent oxidoreductase [Nocardia crassostreae]|uniref:FAD-dependent oxidoreductase n=1 Tax=Nocardia crassostreae TaxID=53428 RepID=UPI0008312951|nr:NAD(P)-binding protein [Nocardia crassostreae]
MRIVLAGAGIAGLSSALLLARSGFQVDLIERDDGPPETFEGVDSWARPGAPQNRHPHVFFGLFRSLLQKWLPDVYEELLEIGAGDINVERPEIHRGAAGDSDLCMIAARRIAVEWVLHRAIGKEPNISLRSGATVREVIVEDRAVVGVVVDGELLPTSILVDACGRGSRLARTFTEVRDETSCDVIYHSRFYRLAPGVEQPTLHEGSVSKVGGHGFGGSLFCHENGFFSITLGRLPEDEALKPLRENDGFEKAIAIIPRLEEWLRNRLPEPHSRVTPIAGLRNTIRDLGPDAPSGYFPIGDALCTTDPSFGRGSPIALAQAVELAVELSGAMVSLREQSIRATGGALDIVRPWFDDAVRMDARRTAYWRAIRTNSVTSPPALDVNSISALALLEAGKADPELWRIAQRSLNMFDGPTAVNTAEVAVRLRDLAGSGWRPTGQGPSYQEMVAALSA